MANINDIIGNYRLVEEIGSGAFGSVYRAEHTILTNRVVAIKLMHGTYLNTHKERESFIQEAKLLEKLKHPSILPIIDVGIYDGIPYMVTQYALNGSLRNRLQRQYSKPLPEKEAIIILVQIGQALHYAHQQNIIHRDLKPENILFNTQVEALLADFGIATALSSLSIKQGTIIGTPPYMAPEQFRGTVSKEGDQYALGCIAYELFTGHRPFTAPDFFAMAFKHLTEQPIMPTQLNPHLPVHVEQAILKAMSKERADRYVTVLGFTEALVRTKEQWLIEGNTHLDAKHPDKALESFEQALSIDSNDASAYFNKGNALSGLKRYREALEAYEQAIRLYSSVAAATYYRYKGDALYNFERYQEALQAYEQAIRLDPDYAWVYNGKARALEALKRHEEALQACEQAIRLDTSVATATYYRNKGNALSGLKRYREALEAYEQAIRLYSSVAAATYYRNKGNALSGLKRYREALEAYEQAIRLDPSNVGVYNGKARALEALKRHEEALQACEQAIRLDPNYAVAYIDKGNILQDLKRYDEALANFEQAIHLDSNSILAYHSKGDILSELKRYKEALTAYEQAIRLNPNDSYAYNGKGNVLSELKRYKEALAAYDQAIHLNPSYSTAYNSKGIALRSLGKIKEADQAFEKAHQLGYNG